VSDPRCLPHTSRRPDTAERVALLGAARSPSFVVRARVGVLRSITRLFAAASIGFEHCPHARDVKRSSPTAPEWAALTLVAATGRSMLVDADPAAAVAAPEAAPALARTDP
jgi:hypothetical protein